MIGIIEDGILKNGGRCGRFGNNGDALGFSRDHSPSYVLFSLREAVLFCTEPQNL